MTAPTIETPPVWQSYLDIANDVKPYLQIPATDTARDSDIRDIIDAACWWAQDTLGRPIAPTTFFRRFNGYTGWGGSNIALPYYPVLGTPTVTEYWGVSGAHPLTLQTPAAQGGSDMFQLDALRGIITRSYLGLLQRPFFPGLKNVEVTWTAGFNPIPRHWILATKELVKFWWVNTQQSSRSFRASVNEGYDQNAAVKYYDGALGVPEDIASKFRGASQVGIA